MSFQYSELHGGMMRIVDDEFEEIVDTTSDYGGSIYEPFIEMYARRKLPVVINLIRFIQYVFTEGRSGRQLYGTELTYTIGVVIGSIKKNDYSKPYRDELDKYLLLR
jgi:hypothetical protein